MFLRPLLLNLENILKHGNNFCNCINNLTNINYINNLNNMILLLKISIFNMKDYHIFVGNNL